MPVVEEVQSRRRRWYRPILLDRTERIAKSEVVSCRRHHTAGTWLATKKFPLPCLGDDGTTSDCSGEVCPGKSLDRLPTGWQRRRWYVQTQHLFPLCERLYPLMSSAF